VVGGAWTFGWDALVAIGTLGLALFAFVSFSATPVASAGVTR
jgi:hypothetical protein